MSEQQRVVIVRDDCPACAAKDEALKDIAEINKAIGKERDELLEIREQRNRELAEKDAEIAMLEAENDEISTDHDRSCKYNDALRNQLATLKSAVREMRKRQTVSAHLLGISFEDSIALRQGSECEVDALVAELEAHESKKA